MSFATLFSQKSSDTLGPKSLVWGINRGLHARFQKNSIKKVKNLKNSLDLRLWDCYPAVFILRTEA